MKVLNKIIGFDDSFHPQMVITIAFPLELVDKSKELSAEDFVKEINQAINEYDKEHKL